MNAIPILAGLAILSLILWARRREQRLWNDGVCAESGNAWIHFDNDSSGARGYKDGSGNYAWISYNFNCT